MPPVSQCASALRVKSERRIASAHSFGGSNAAAQPDQEDSTCLNASAPDSGGGAGRNDGDQLRTKLTSCPAAIVNSPTVRKSSPRSSAAVSSKSLSGPAV